MLKYLTPLITFVYLSSAHASEGDYYLDVHLVSKHSQSYYYDNAGKPQQFNEQNLGIGLAYQFSPSWRVGGGFYDNSYHKTSAYLGVEGNVQLYKYMWAGVAVAAVTGYQGTPTQTPLIFLPMITVGNERVRAKIGIAPIGEIQFMTFTLETRL